jgi:hypothetical protein
VHRADIQQACRLALGEQPQHRLGNGGKRRFSFLINMFAKQVGTLIKITRIRLQTSKALLNALKAVDLNGSAFAADGSQGLTNIESGNRS